MLFANYICTYIAVCIISIQGAAGIVWYVAWLLLVFNTPADHPRISPEEQHYIESTIKEEMHDKISTKVVVNIANNYVKHF